MPDHKISDEEIITHAIEASKPTFEDLKWKFYQVKPNEFWEIPDGKIFQVYFLLASENVSVRWFPMKDMENLYESMNGVIAAPAYGAGLLTVLPYRHQMFYDFTGASEMYAFHIDPTPYEFSGGMRFQCIGVNPFYVLYRDVTKLRCRT